MMKMMRNSTWLFALVICFLLSCNKDDDKKVDTVSVNVENKEVLIDVVDIYNRHLVGDRFADFNVVGNGNVVDTYLVERDGNTYLGFKPTIPIDFGEKDIINSLSKVYMGSEEIAVVESTFKLDTVKITSEGKAFYYTNTENNVSSRPADTPIRLLVGSGFSYREEGRGKFCVVFDFPKTKMQSTETIDYNVSISGFMGQSITPIQKGLAVTDGAGDTQQVTLAIEGVVHNYYDAKGTLQEPYDIVYEISSLQLFGNDEKHIVKVTTSGDCNSNKIRACCLDGQQLNLTTVVEKDFFGREYVNLTIE